VRAGAGPATATAGDCSCACGCVHCAPLLYYTTSRSTIDRARSENETCVQAGPGGRRSERDPGMLRAPPGGGGGRREGATGGPPLRFACRQPDLLSCRSHLCMHPSSVGLSHIPTNRPRSLASYIIVYMQANDRASTETRSVSDMQQQDALLRSPGLSAIPSKVLISHYYRLVLVRSGLDPPSND
jgi:hypothetical protein